MMECIEYAKDVCELAPAWPGDAAPCAATPHAPASRHAGRRIPPATWVVIALAMPVLCWDVWRTERDMRLGRQAPIQHAELSTIVSAPSIPNHRPGFRPW
jgi:hypothetical protein